MAFSVSLIQQPQFHSLGFSLPSSAIESSSLWLTSGGGKAMEARALHLDTTRPEQKGHQECVRRAQV